MARTHPRPTATQQDILAPLCTQCGFLWPNDVGRLPQVSCHGAVFGHRIKSNIAVLHPASERIHDLHQFACLVNAFPQSRSGVSRNGSAPIVASGAPRNATGALVVGVASGCER